MKKLVILFLLLAPAFVFSQAKQDTAKAKPVKEFKAGEYTMKQYYFVMLVKGARRSEITDTAVINQLQRGHMANMDSMAKAGKLLVAGPFGDDGNWRGIFIIDADTKEEVEQLLKKDPAIAAGRLDYEIHPWWTAKNSVFK
ncbi:YciI family protein [Aridibaculum aurantiacum]|uniref:YciI family protein n=1 Tax=Aridibaculum aurantiacum TaxID=2810307 RepID=UPI001A96F126|nr:YciI family protein [Aridibaculum aurantiacum]